MKKFILVLFLFATLISGCGSDNGNTYGEEMPKVKQIVLDDKCETRDVASAIAPAVVGVCGIKNNGESVGSGVAVSADGYVLTNSHVINGCNDITLYMVDKTTTSAKIVYEDSVLDFAILKSVKPLPYLNIASSKTLAVGDDVLAVGTPLSLSLTHSFTKGIVSALNRTLKVSNTGGEGYMQNLIQHDASLNPGNSGGPLVNAKGEVVGINTLKISGGEGVGFAIPTQSFMSLLSSFMSKSNYSVPYLGVYGYDTSIANYYDKTNEERGFYVLGVAPNSPLKDANITSGDVIVSINDIDIDNTLDLKEVLYRSSSSETISLGYKSGGRHYITRTKLCRES